MVHVGVSALLRGISVRAFKIRRKRLVRRARQVVGAWRGKPRANEPVRTFSVPSGFSSTRPPLAIALTAMALIACSTAALGTLLAAGWLNDHSLPAPAEIASNWQQMQTGALPRKSLEMAPPEQPADEGSAWPVEATQAPAPVLPASPVQAAQDPALIHPAAPVQAAEGSVAVPPGAPAQAAERPVTVPSGAPAPVAAGDDPTAAPPTEMGGDPASRSVAAAAPAGSRGSKDASPNRQDGPFAGVWATNEKACSPQLNRDGLLPALISSEGAWAGETTCSFKKSKRVGNTWTFAAVCSDNRRRWKADVRMSVVGNRLTWTSQRGSQTYVRCQNGLLEAYERKKPISRV
jgi:hypothetical protein